ncbi:carboxylesterase/lipase family protein [Novosphingobium sp. KA1]|uniref:carboxylesterase/lipase family protein n=1 Tax=Novosphingobium sp. (strain KA1) TaxID=164608 RepID=UPI001A8FC8DA|nr:carboxylesterase family protein [Novosphingobium sp. KA1]QSR17576.1 carboxylesterase [Novosphingobium sp. KA1]
MPFPLQEATSGAETTRRAVLAGGAVALAAGAAPVLATPPQMAVAGRCRGVVENGICQFLGIRYGRAARFARAVAEPFGGAPLEALRFGPICPQRGLDDQPQSEDCLFLNVWTPEANPAARRAVMVYFHGGAYTTGSVTDPLTHGAKLAAGGDVVVVTVNHRLNALGYAWLKPFGAKYADSGNLGQLDLILALQWVRAHIAAFGGDPARVMVFGQSGGGAKIATLMAMPAARGLFHAAATMSGQQVQASGPMHAWARTQALMAALGLSPGDVEALRTMPVERLTAALDTTDPVMGSGPVYFGPVLDMTNLPRHPFWPDAAPQSLSVPMILGNVHDETRAFLDPRGPKLKGLDWSNVAARMGREVKIDLDPQWVIDQYRAREPGWSVEQVYYAATTAGRSWPGQVIEADERAKAGAAATWVYQLDRPSPLDPLRGAAHTDDIPYVFGTLDAKGSFSGTDAAAQALSTAMMGAFTGLAKTGRPGIADWAAYTLPQRATMVFGDTVRVEADPRGWQRELWATAPYVQPGT